MIITTTTIMMMIVIVPRYGLDLGCNGNEIAKKGQKQNGKEARKRKSETQTGVERGEVVWL